MKFKVIFVMYCVSAIVKGAFWGAVAVEPVIQMLGLGSIFAAWNVAKKPGFDKIFNQDSES